MGSAVPTPPNGWDLATDFTKRAIPGALFERSMGDPDEGCAPYDMTIVLEGSAFIPIHGSVRLLPCETADAAALSLEEFYSRLPDESRLTEHGYRRKHGSSVMGRESRAL